MSELKIFSFDVPVSGRETFSVIASSYEEALEKMQKDDFYVKPETCDIEWDFGLGQDSDEHLHKCFIMSDFEEPTNDQS